jgi:hypothetical protein
MDAGHNSSRLEQAVLAAERRVVTRSPWYNHRAIWGAIGVAIGLAASPLYQQVLTPEKVSAREPGPAYNGEAHSAAQRLIQDLKLSAEADPKPEEPAEAAKVDKLKQVIKEIRGDVPYVPHDLQALPAVMPNATLRGPLSVAPYHVEIPEIQARPLKAPEAKQPSHEDLEVKRKVEALQSQITNLKSQREELLKSFYEDAIPVKHVDEDIAQAESEIKALQHQ